MSSLGGMRFHARVVMVLTLNITENVISLDCPNLWLCHTCLILKNTVVNTTICKLKIVGRHTNLKENADRPDILEVVLFVPESATAVLAPSSL